MATALTPTNNIGMEGLPTGSRLEILDGILKVGYKEAPIIRAIKRVKVGNLKSIWHTDSYEKPTTNSAKKYVESFDNEASNTIQKVENVVQLYKNDVAVADVMEFVDMYGSDKMLSHELAKKSVKHLRNIEATFWSDNIPYLSQNDTEKNICGGVSYFCPQSKSFFCGTEDATGTLTYLKNGDTPTKYKANKVLTVDAIFDLQQAVWEDGGDPKTIYVSAKLKRKINALIEAKKLYKVSGGDTKKVDMMVDYIETDFGTTEIVISRYLHDLNMNDRMLCVDLSTVELGELMKTTVKDVTLSETAKAKRIQSALTFHFRNQLCIAIGYGFKYE